MTSLRVSLPAESVESVRRRAGVHETWQRCCQSFGRYLTARLRGRADLVDDLMQQLWLQAVGRWESCRDEDSEPWMWRIVQNLLREHWRREGGSIDRRVRVDAALARDLAGRLDREELPDEVLLRGEVQEQLVLAITSLPAADQELLIGSYFEQLSHSQLAARLGVGERAIEGRLYRARAALRARLDQDEFGEMVS